MSRLVTLALVDSEGSSLGALPPFGVERPYWQSVDEIVKAVRDRYGFDASVLRILSTEPGLIKGGRVTYLAEVGHRPAAPLTPYDLDLAEHPLRPDYARPGGPARSLNWAAAVLGARVTAEQQRTWNLSAIWRLTGPAGTMWLKQVPGFFFHEAAVLSYLDQVYAYDSAGRMLLRDIPGEDLYGVGCEVREAIAADIIAIQLRAASDLDRLARAGVPDLRGGRLASRLRRLLDEPWVTQRLDAALACGLPETLVHGDLHPGNVRGTPSQRTIIDWGDSFLGHPAFDIIRLSEGLDPAEEERLIAFWASAWRSAVPGCDPLTAVEALRPVAALRNAMVYAAFLENIEPSEHPYHVQDVPYWLAKATGEDVR
jgi:hypothetical protein